MTELRLYDYAASANCYKVRLLLAQHDQPYERVPIDIFAGDTQILRWLIIEQTVVIPTMGGLRFRLMTGRLHADDPDARRRHEGAQQVLALLDEHLRDREFLLGDHYTIADIANYAYVHVAGDAGLDLTRFPAVAAWLTRVAAQPGFINDLEPYPANAQAGAGSSIYG